MSRHNNNNAVLSKMFLISPETYEKFKTKVKEADALKLLQDEAKQVLGTEGNDDDKWLKYRDLMVKRGDQVRRQQQPQSNEDDYAVQQGLNEQMDRVLKTAGPVNPSEKWLKYRGLLMEASQKRRGANMNAFANRLKQASLDMLKRDFQKIEANKRLTRSEKLTKYRLLLAKHGVRQRSDDGRELSLEQIQQGMKRLGEFQMQPTPQPKMLNKKSQTTVEMASTGAQTDGPINTEEILVHAPEEVFTEHEMQDLERERLNLSARQEADRLRLRKSRWQAEDDGDVVVDDDDDELNASNSLFSTPLQKHAHESRAGVTPIRYGSAALLSPGIRKIRAQIRNERLEGIRQEHEQHQRQEGLAKRPSPGQQSYIRSLSNELANVGGTPSNTTTTGTKKKNNKSPVGLQQTTWKGKDIAEQFRKMTGLIPKVVLEQLASSPTAQPAAATNRRKMTGATRAKAEPPYEGRTTRRRATTARTVASSATALPINTVANFFPQSKQKKIGGSTQSGTGHNHRRWLNSNVCAWERYQ